MRIVKKAKKYDLGITHDELRAFLGVNKRPNGKRRLLQIREPLAGHSFYVYNVADNVCERSVTTPYGYPQLAFIRQSKKGKIEVAASLPRIQIDWGGFQISTASHQMTKAKILVIRDVSLNLKKLVVFILKLGEFILEQQKKQKKEVKDEDENYKEEAAALVGAAM